MAFKLLENASKMNQKMNLLIFTDASLQNSAPGFCDQPLDRGKLLIFSMQDILKTAPISREGRKLLQS